MNSNRPHLRPQLSLSDIVGPDLIYNPRPSYTPYGWLTTDPEARAVYTGGALSVAGQTPTICAAGLTGVAATRLCELAGIEALPPVIRFDGRAEYEAILERLAREGRRLLFQHVHPVGEVPESLYAVPRQFLADLNNKARLHAFVPPEFVPPRTIIAPQELHAFAAQNRTYPLVVKGGGPMSSGAGGAVVMVRGPVDWAVVENRLAAAEQMVIETYLDVRDNFCLNYFSQGTASCFLGGSRQLTDSDGGYLGNWFDPQDPPPATAIAAGHAIMNCAIALGYRGVAGFDVVVDRSDHVRVIDLNFRLNGSTPALMWGDSLWRHRRGTRVAKSISLTIRADALDTLETLVSGHSVFPLTVFDSRELRSGSGNIEVRGLALGQTAWEIRRLEASLSTICGATHGSGPDDRRRLERFAPAHPNDRAA